MFCLYLSFVGWFCPEPCPRVIFHFFLPFLSDGLIYYSINKIVSKPFYLLLAETQHFSSSSFFGFLEYEWDSMIILGKELSRKLIAGFESNGGC
ncbi:hypothetical protein VNO77_21948 [Canavalia gladiata]|uniref:Uncharacterized protein n=1 Tax=Canavalia gladiata TaxID=3824 RepID=A0AAN9L1N8_CANGL